MVDQTHVVEALKGVQDPELRKSLVELGMVHDVQVDGDAVRFTLALTTMACPLKDSISGDARDAVLALDGIENVEITLREPGKGTGEPLASFSRAAVTTSNFYQPFDRFVRYD